jgi:hypothetical protein
MEFTRFVKEPPMPRLVRTEDEAWAIGGGRFERAQIPDWIQTDVIDAVLDDFSVLTNWFSRQYRISLIIGLTGDYGVRPSTIAFRDNAFVCMVPIGLVLRVDYMMRLLEREHAAENIHVVDPDFYGDLPEPMRREREKRVAPFPISVIADRKGSDEAFWAGLELLDSVDAIARSSYRGVQIDLVRMGICFAALHEAAHAVRRHPLILAKSNNRELAARNAELDADYAAGRWLAFARMDELRTNVGLSDPNFFLTVAESSWRITYACSVILGLFDLDRLAIGQFSAGAYLHPSTRLMLVVNSMLNAFRKGLPIPRDDEMKIIVELSAEGASAYMARITQVWLKNDPAKQCHRPTSLYFPLGGGGEKGELIHSLFEKASKEYWAFIEQNMELLDGERLE